jgi:multidrug transporter EmrE-like cation transporter
MGYIFIIIAVLAATYKGYCGKMTSNQISMPRSALGFSTVRMLFALAVGLIFVFIDSASLSFSAELVTVSAVSGIANAALIVSWLFCVRAGAYMLVDGIQATMGIVIPTVAGLMFFNEIPRINDIIGIVMLIAASVVMCSYSGKIKGKLGVSGYILLLTTGLSAGMVFTCQKWYAQRCSEVPASVYNLYSYVFATVFLAVFYLVFKLKKLPSSIPEKHEAGSAKMKKRLVLFAILMALCMFFNTYFSTLAAGKLPAAQLYPVMQGLTTICSVAMSSVFFKEKITLTCAVGLILNFAALMIINLL